MKHENISACPFCGHEGNKISVHYYTIAIFNLSFKRYKVRCGYCGAYQAKDFRTEKQAIKAWNKWNK